jgi:hypothetical protein
LEAYTGIQTITLIVQIVAGVGIANSVMVREFARIAMGKEKHIHTNYKSLMLRPTQIRALKYDQKIFSRCCYFNNNRYRGCVCLQ